MCLIKASLAIRLDDGDTMNIDLYSDRSKAALQAAQSLAHASGHQQFAPEHLLKALLEDRDGSGGAPLAQSLITAAGGQIGEVTAKADAALAKLPKVEGGSGQLYMAPHLSRVFSTAEADAKKAGDAFVTTERLLIALAKDGAAAAEARFQFQSRA